MTLNRLGSKRLKRRRERSSKSNRRMSASALSPSARARRLCRRRRQDREAVLAAINRLTSQRRTAIGSGILTSLDAIFEEPGAKQTVPSARSTYVPRAKSRADTSATRHLRPRDYRPAERWSEQHRASSAGYSGTGIESRRACLHRRRGQPRGNDPEH